MDEVPRTGSLAFRPSLVGLGEDVRPALAPPRERCGWDLGLRSSICERYRLYLDPSAASRNDRPADDSRRSHDEHDRIGDIDGLERLKLARILGDDWSEPA